jgi:phage/plasmid-like protein (TIGR03299 family)
MRSNDLDQSGAGMLRDAAGNGIDSMLAVGKPPWHYAANADMIRLQQLGNKVTSKQVNQLAGLTWTVYQTPAYHYVGEQPALDEDGFLAEPVPGRGSHGFKLVGTQREAGAAPEPDYYLNIRDDLHCVVGVVKKRYRVFQNIEAPIFLDNLVDSGDAHYETAGSLHGGSQVWWLMKLPDGITIAGDPREKIETYILLTNSHDGSTSIVTAVVPIRVVCQNTLAWSLTSAIRTAKVRHTESARDQFIEARRILEIGFTYQAELAEIGDQLANTTLSDAQFHAFLNSLLPTPNPITKDGRTTNQRGITMAENTKNLITGIYHHNDTQTHLEGTLWGAVQAVQYYSDHLSINRNTDDASANENRFKRLTSGATLGNSGLAHAKTLISQLTTQHG